MVPGPPRVLFTASAVELLRRLQDRHGPVMFHQSGGCCDGSSPMCYPDGEFIVGDRDVLLGIVADTPVWISGTQFETWKHTQLVIDVVPGRGGGFSLEAPEGMRFLSRGRVFSPAELESLAAEPPLTGADYAAGARPRDQARVDDDAERSDAEESADQARVDDDAERSDAEESADQAPVDGDAVADCQITVRRAEEAPG